MPAGGVALSFAPGAALVTSVISAAPSPSQGGWCPPLVS